MTDTRIQPAWLVDPDATHEVSATFASALANSAAGKVTDPQPLRPAAPQVVEHRLIESPWDIVFRRFLYVGGIILIWGVIAGAAWSLYRLGHAGLPLGGQIELPTPTPIPTQTAN